MSEDYLLPDENNIGLMLREYNLIASRNKMLEGNCFVNNDVLADYRESEAERNKLLGKEYAELYCTEQDLCTSLYRLHSLSIPRYREEISKIIGEVKRNTKKIMECYSDICADKVDYAPKIELSMNYWKLLRDIISVQHNTMLRLTAIESPCEKVHSIIHTELVINGILNTLLSMYKM